MRTVVRTAQFNREIKTNAVNNLHKWSSFVESRAKQLVPVDTGNLRSSIHSEVNVVDLWAKTGSNTKYAEPVEFGTYASREPEPFDTHTTGARPQPYLRPAFDELMRKI